ncbi:MULTISPECIES: catechol 1,2-dioxygenase [unclassified Luteococcus]|uniref:catechol 1,2-dioxygenase n=1 Tax=unclassified Luteococcus TaxID=2639923 RepID=UPI00313E08D4
MSQYLEEESKGTAAQAGAGATANFERDKAAAFDAVKDTPKERVDMLAKRILGEIEKTIREEDVTYDEYNALKAWLIQVGLDGEWPLFLDVWVEHIVEEVATKDRKGSKGTIEGPYYVPNSPVCADGQIPMRDDEPGQKLQWTGTVLDTDGKPMEGAKIELWHADDLGFYSQFAPGQPEWNLRGTFPVNADGTFTINTIQPSPYQIPTDGACGKLIAAAGWHAWRPAHLHVKVSAPGHQLLTAQLYFPGDEHNDDDIASAVKPELILDPKDQGNGTSTVEYGFVLDKADA